MNFTNTPTNFTSNLIALPEKCDKCGDIYEILRDNLTGQAFGKCAKCINHELSASSEMPSEIYTCFKPRFDAIYRWMASLVRKNPPSFIMDEISKLVGIVDRFEDDLKRFHAHEKPPLTCVCRNQAKQNCLACDKPVCRSCIDGYNTTGVVCKECARCPTGY